MKKYKVYWSLLNLLSESQSEVVKLQTLFKGLSGSITAGTWFGIDANHAIWVGMAGYLIDLVIGCFYFEIVTDEKAKP